MLSAFLFINILYVGFLLGLIYYLIRFKSPADSAKITKKEPLSLIISLRNESDKVARLFIYLDKLISHFNKIQVILIDDNSKDGTEKLLQDWYSSLHNKDRVKILNVTDQIPSKKKAIAEALKHVSCDWVVQSDADCDINIDWLKSISAIDKSVVNFIAGPVAFKTRGFWSSLLTLESWALIAISYLGFKKNLPQMCSAANITWNRTLLGEHNYSDIINLNDPSGDDAYLLEYFKSKNSILSYNWDKNALIWTDPPKSIKEFFNQRLRWASKWGAVKGKSQIFFPAMLWLFHLAFIVLSISLIISENYLLLISIVLCKASFEYFMLKLVANHFNQKINPFKVLIMQLLYSPYVVIFGLLSQFANYRWK